MRSIVSRALLPVGILSLSAALPAAAGVTNGSFEADPPTGWLRPAAPPAVPGDKPHVARAGTGPFGRIGDRDGRGADGENPSLLLQRFPCGDAEGGSCAVSFRFRATLHRGETAWIRLRSGEREAAWPLPSTEGEWRGPVTVHLPGCGPASVDFGLRASGEGAVSGTLDVDDVRSECGASTDGADFPPPDPDLPAALPPLPADPADGERPLALVTPHGATDTGIAALVVAALFVTFFLLFVLKKAREPKPVP
jgi:hypothetical protein